MKPIKWPGRWKQTVYLVVGIALVPIGIIIAPLPGPMGIPTIALGVLLIVSSSRRAAGWVRLHRRKWDWMHEVLEKGEIWVGGEFGHALRRTNGRRTPPRPPLPFHRRVLDFLLLPVYLGLIALRAVGRRFGWSIPGVSAPVNLKKTRVDKQASDG